MMGHVGFTGSRQGVTKAQEERITYWLKSYEWLHHGDCVGADRVTHMLALHCQLRICIHPPQERKFRAMCRGDETRHARPYLTRNRNIVDETYFLIAAPNNYVNQLRSGTWSTIRYASAAGKAHVIIFPDGTEDVNNATR